MIAYAIVLLTDIEDVETACRIDMQLGTDKYNICGETVRSFVRCTNHAYYDFPHGDCLAYGLTLVPPEMRSIFEYLYETLREILTWSAPG